MNRERETPPIAEERQPATQEGRARQNLPAACLEGPKRALVPLMLYKRAVRKELGDERIGAQALRDRVRERMVSNTLAGADIADALTSEQTDFLLLRLMSLSEQYLVTPANASPL